MCHRHPSRIVRNRHLLSGRLQGTALAAVGTALAAIGAAFASFFSDETTAEGRETIVEYDVSNCPVV